MHLGSQGIIKKCKETITRSFAKNFHNFRVGNEWPKKFLTKFQGLITFYFNVLQKLVALFPACLDAWGGGANFLELLT